MIMPHIMSDWNASYADFVHYFYLSDTISLLNGWNCHIKCNCVGKLLELSYQMQLIYFSKLLSIKKSYLFHFEQINLLTT